MQYKFFIIPVKPHQETENDLNRFLRSVRVLAVHREFVAQGENSFWSMAIEYLDGAGDPAKKGGAGKSRIDYKQVLSPEAFALFAKLRDWRKELAGKEAVPVCEIL